MAGSALFKAFRQLELLERKSGEYPVVSLSKRKHKLGITFEGFPVIFISAEHSTGTSIVDNNLELITVQYSRQFELLGENKKAINGVYTIVSLKSESSELVVYFLEIMELLINSLPDKFSIIDLRLEIRKLVSLFNRLSQPAIKSVQGIWAELLVIALSHDSEYLIRSWHIDQYDSFDFNDGIDKVEVKSTSRKSRVHTFSASQLNPNPNSRLAIVSVMIIRSGDGKSIGDLVELIKSKVSDPGVVFLLLEKIAICLGEDLRSVDEIRFDYQYATDNLAVFYSHDIPTIEVQLVAEEITNIHFDCDLTKAKALNKKHLKGKLLKCIAIV